MLSCHLHSTFSALSSSLALNSVKFPHKSGHAQAHLLILLGPSLFGPRARILLTIDGLKVQAWNYRTEGETLTECKDENQCSGGNADNKLNRMHRLDHIRSPLSSIPPPATNILYGNDPTNPEHSDTGDRASLVSRNSSDSPPSPDGPLTGYPGEQQALSAAERLLSRSLAMACAEDGVTLNAELGPDYPSTVEPKF